MRMAFGLTAALLAASVLPSLAAAQSQPPSQPTYNPYPIAVLQGLDKVTARISTVEAPVDQEVTFGSLRIMARTCRKRPPEETPETAAFLEIHDQKPGEQAQSLFSGWMFASSPALNPLHHPVYDVWVIDCKKAE